MNSINLFILLVVLVIIYLISFSKQNFISSSKEHFEDILATQKIGSYVCSAILGCSLLAGSVGFAMSYSKK
jgi:hypothetical protein